ARRFGYSALRRDIHIIRSDLPRPRAEECHGRKTISGHAYGRGVAPPAHPRAISGSSPPRDRAGGQLRAQLREARRHVLLRGMWSAALCLEAEIRERDWLAQFQ